MHKARSRLFLITIAVEVILFGMWIGAAFVSSAFCIRGPFLSGNAVGGYSGEGKLGFLWVEADSSDPIVRWNFYPNEHVFFLNPETAKGLHWEDDGDIVFIGVSYWVLILLVHVVLMVVWFRRKRKEVAHA